MSRFYQIEGGMRRRGGPILSTWKGGDTKVGLFYPTKERGEGEGYIGGSILSEWKGVILRWANFIQLNGRGEETVMLTDFI